MFQCDLSIANDVRFGIGSFYRPSTSCYCIVGLLADCCGQLRLDMPLSSNAFVSDQFQTEFSEKFDGVSPTQWGQHHFDAIAFDDNLVGVDSEVKDQEWAKARFDWLVQLAVENGFIQIVERE